MGSISKKSEVGFGLMFLKMEPPPPEPVEQLLKLRGLSKVICNMTHPIQRQNNTGLGDAKNSCGQDSESKSLLNLFSVWKSSPLSDRKGKISKPKSGALPFSYAD